MDSSANSDSGDRKPQAVVRHAREGDLPAAAEVFLAAFPEALAALGLERLAPKAMEDIFRICLDAEAEGFFVAEVEERLVGYVICVSRPGRLWLTAVRPRHAFRMLCRLLAGRYGIGLRGLMRLGADRIRFWLSHMKCSGERGAQILSIAVHPNFQGQGLGRRLMQAALGYLRSAGARQVKLEVRPQNSPALRLYERIGFRPVGTVRDSRGPWLVMVLRLEEDKDG